MEFLNALMEGRTSFDDTSDEPADVDISSLLNDHLVWCILIENLNTHIIDNDDNKYKNDREYIIYQYYAFINTLAQVESFTGEEFSQTIPNNKLTGKFARIEILNRDNHVEVVYFQKPEEVIRFWNTTAIRQERERILEFVDRDNPKEKLKSFMDRGQSLIDIMDHQQRLKRWFMKHRVLSFFFYFFIRRLRWLQILSLILSLVLNGIMIEIYKADGYVADGDGLVTVDDTADKKFTPGTVEDISGSARYEEEDELMRIGGITFLVIAAISFVAYCINWLPIWIRRTLRSRELNSVQKFLFALRAIVQDNNFLFEASMLAVSIVSLKFYYIYAATLLIWIWQTKMSRYVLQSVFIHFDQVMVTLALGLTILYWYSLISFFNWRGEYRFEDTMNCQSLKDCYRTHIDLGFMSQPVWDSTPTPWQAAAYNLSYVLIINLIITAIISGIIIDTFADMRSSQEAVNRDQEDKCFICSIKRDEFENNGIPFAIHTKTEHHMWAYIWFKLYLESKPYTEYTGLESYIRQAVDEKSISYMPINTSLALTGKYENTEDEMDELFAAVESIQDLEQNTSQKFESFQRRIEYDIDQLKKDVAEFANMKDVLLSVAAKVGV
eukprot:CAMPEP_0115021882 /NCGR_PEP_ID=MMETSP0216-20121206/31174_1 /TAXON_ID=223996 /ORGANISM="Protocruzia adherens, Strain Boccale" /LENGTH=609 /DNA_ID=CAMNT_0002394369 /DNA_START=33 /DNA_END=1863 /DNA_ORIENTATION=-